jgi:DNA topoisomerase-1
MPIIIVESPNKIKKIREITGSQVYATVGHFADMPQNSLGINIETYEPEFIINPDKKDNVDKIINACDGETVYIASDADREGYAIGMLLYEQIKNKADQCYRLEIREITEKGIKEAMSQAVKWEETNYKFYDAFLGRRVADRLVGYILSPLVSNALKGRFSAGRVQSPAARLVVDREKEIRNFKPSQFFTISATLKSDEKAFTAKFAGYPADSESFKTKEDALKIINEISLIKYAEVVNVDKKLARRSPKAPFTTVDLQAAASISLSFSPDKTMKVAQSLFETGLITYHRTDSVRLSDEFIGECHDFVSSKFGSEFVPETAKKFSSNSQAEAHEAVRPTHLHTIEEISSKIKEAGLTVDEEKLYTLIFKRAVASTMSDATFDSTSYKFDIGGQPFKASGSVPVFKGWTALYVEETEDEKEAEQTLPELKEGVTCSKSSVDLEEKMTKAPGRYTEASLVKTLEKLGIGRPSTYASIIGRIKSAGYVEIEKKKLKATESGERLIDFLNAEHEWVIDYTTTAQMEEYLDKVAEGIDGAKWQTFVKGTHEKMNFFIPEQRDPAEKKAPSEKQIELAQNIATKKGIQVPATALEDSRELSKFLDKHITKVEEIGNCKCGGAVKEWDKSFQCQGCKSTVWKEFLGKKLTKTQAINLLNGKTIALSGLKSKTGKEFDAKGVLKDGKIELIFEKKGK